MENQYRILIVTYWDETDTNLSMLKDDLNNLDVQDGIADRNIIIEYIRRKDADFKIELIGYDGDVKYTSDKYFEKFFENLFSIIDKMPIGKIEKELEEISESITEDSITKEDYERMKRKYLNLKKKILN